MIQLSELRGLLTLKRRLGAVVAAGSDGFQPTRREVSEGLARSLTIDGRSWTYSSDGDGYRFACARARTSVRVGPQSDEHDCFTPAELTDWLANQTRHERINQLVIENWLIGAVRQGLVSPVPHRPGHYRLAHAHSPGVTDAC